MDDVDEIREASRRIVRALGFLDATLAGTDLSASAVHAIIEVGSGMVSSSKDLSKALRLEKSTVSRLVKGLIDRGLMSSQVGAGDARLLQLGLTEKGKSLLGEVSTYGRQQVTDALCDLPPSERQKISQGLVTYARALEGSSGGMDTASHGIEIVQGYSPTLLGRVVQMHAAYYSTNFGFGQVFESKVAGEMAEFLSRLDNTLNATWFARANQEIVGAVSIDGEDLWPGFAHLRWFIVDDHVRGSGTGRRLLSAAMAFIDEQQFEETHLWTFKGLDAARGLYEREGFALVEEQAGEQWGTKVMEQKFVRRRA